MRLSIHDHGMSLHLFRILLISFKSVFWLAVNKFFTSPVKLIPKCFILFDAYINGIAFRISYVHYCQYRNKVNFYMLTLYPVTLLNSYILVIFCCRFCRIHFLDFIYLFLERREGRDRGRETSTRERNISCLLYVPQPGTEPTT